MGEGVTTHKITPVMQGGGVRLGIGRLLIFSHKLSVKYVFIR